MNWGIITLVAFNRLSFNVFSFDPNKERALSSNEFNWLFFSVLILIVGFSD